MATLATARLAPSRRPFNLAALIGRAYATWRQRRQLAALDAHARRDIGLTEGEALREALRPAWSLGAW
ncbi:hypothetical protein roselon_02070 [Roseibacterium elongatum DSM 19469]|uniref:YjiS-like domain-containing protein n=1 Tax=Roseicyclus elongatus DSM 19469 TaxID=1294273 RepID=W8S6F8_9RHOB|nr:DUF1127 domain-containing protein [Roseibacterium elongatum]AHM04421.1 hypothetical protein roselon_02070 [Roseibacterium elongatum DSM 19469]